MKGRLFSMLTVPAAMALAVVSTQASATPSQAQIDRARANCHAHKVRVNALRDQLGPENEAIKPELRTWERACAQAQALMDLRDGKPVLQAELPSGAPEYAAFESKECD